MVEATKQYDAGGWVFILFLSKSCVISIHKSNLVVFSRRQGGGTRGGLQPRRRHIIASTPVQTFSVPDVAVISILDNFHPPRLGSYFVGSSICRRIHGS